MLGATRVDADESEAVTRGGVLTNHHLVVGDEEVGRSSIRALTSMR